MVNDDISDGAQEAARERDRAALRSRLVAIKLRTLVAEHLDVDLDTDVDTGLDTDRGIDLDVNAPTGGDNDPGHHPGHHPGGVADQPSGFPLGAALIHDGAAWVYLDGAASTRLGAALAWSLRNGATKVNVIAEDSTGLLARRAEGFRLPIEVWFAEGRSLIPAVAEPLMPPPNVPQHHETFTATIEAAGVTPVHEFGVLVGEVRGLEVCRVVDDPSTGSTRLEVGVGAHDREAFQMMHGDVPTAESLARVADVAAQHRTADAAPHPLNRLAAERLLRARLIADPALIGASELAVESPPLPRLNLKDPTPCVAFGHDADGAAVVVVCSTGVDLELIPYTIDARLAVQERRPGVVVGRTVVMTPIRDRIAITSLLADQLERQVELSSLEP